MYKIIFLSLLILIAAVFMACSDTPSSSSNKGEANPGDTPTLAYKRLFAAVKSKDTEAIKRELSKSTHGFAASLAARQDKPTEEIYKNGFTATTFSESLPELRDERVKDKMGALEVWNSTDKKWEDLPFVREESGWKLAIGDVFANTYRSPGKGRDMIEKEAANAMSGNNGMKRVEISNVNANFKSGPRPPVPQR